MGMNLRLGLLALIVVTLTIGLIFIWNRLPRVGEPVPPPSGSVDIIKTPEGVTETACKAAGGNWVECGSPCFGTGAEACIQVCEAQCQCGGIAGFSCPSDLVCTDYEPGPGVPDAIGVCRKTAREPLLKTTESEIEPTTPVRERPSGAICDERNFICVDGSVSGTTLTNPFTVKGTGIAFENTINWRLLNGDGSVLIEGNVIATAPEIGQAGDFEIRAFILTVPKTPTGMLEVLEYSAKDGAPIHVVDIPVKFPSSTMSVTLFYPLNDPQSTDCSVVFSEGLDVPRSALPVETSLRVLLESPGAIGATSSIPKGTRLVLFKVSGGTATAVFSPELENGGGGSCIVQAIRAQIEQTLKQFSSIKKVVISVEGKTPEETLQP